MPKPVVSSPLPFDSKLATGAERFLCQVVVHALEAGWRSPDDFIRHFPPREIVESLAENDDLRATLLVRAAKVHAKAAPKKSVASGAEDLELALTEGLCSPQDVLDVYDPDSRVRHLAAPKLWAFVVEGNFWEARAQTPEHENALARMVFTLERALGQQLISLADLGDGLTFREISERLPVDVLRRLVLHSLATGRNGRALDEQSLLESVPLPELVSYIPLDYTWEHVVLAKVARPQGFTGEASSPVKRASVPPPPPKPVSAPLAVPKPAPLPSKPITAPKLPVQDEKREIPPPPPPPMLSDAGPYVDVEESELEFEESSRHSGTDDPARNEAVERLRAIDRLPPSHASLSLPVLLSVESMYEDLESASTDDTREQIIRDSFPNESHLRQAMLALIELLDPSIDTNEPLIRDADIDSLIKIVLFEERRRYERAHPSQKPSHSMRPRPFGGSRPPPGHDDDFGKRR